MTVSNVSLAALQCRASALAHSEELPAAQLCFGVPGTLEWASCVGLIGIAPN